MFSKTDNSDDSDRVVDKAPSSLTIRPAPKDAIPSLVSANLQVVGNLTTDGELQIDGMVEGDVSCGRLTVGETAVISGEIKADEVEIRGTVQGKIHGRSVHVAKMARMVGDIWHDSLSMEAGAFLDGHLRRNSSAEG
jgi:cytoskeletal protein CcmA (bactofilin family)